MHYGVYIFYMLNFSVLPQRYSHSDYLEVSCTEDSRITFVLMFDMCSDYIPPMVAIKLNLVLFMVN